MENTNTLKTPVWLNVIRILVGVLFIFSGLIKANDPLGLSFKMQEFFHNWNLSPSLDQYTLNLAIAIITFEILAGFALLIGFAFRTFSYLLLILIIFFTFLTGYAVWYNIANGRELKCGCFGDCIPLTANQSFAKDVILFVLIVLLVVYRSRIKPLFKKSFSIILILVVIVVSFLIQFYALRHLPYIDCLPYKPGNSISESRQRPSTGSTSANFDDISYKITKDGVARVYSYEEYMNDSTLWELEVEEVKSSNVVELPTVITDEDLLSEFSIMDQKGTDYTDALLSDEGYYFLWIIRDPEKANLKNIDRIQKIYQETLKGETVGVIVLTSGSVSATKAILEKNQLQDLEVLLLDATTSKTMMRSNPGLMLLQKGKIIGKWSYMDYPKTYKLQNDKIILE